MSLKKSNNELNDINNSSLYQRELALKDKLIISLQNKINNLILNKNSLISQIDNHSLKNISPPKNISKNNLHSSIHLMQIQNTLLRNKLNLSAKIGKKFNNTFQFRLFSAQKEIENLTIMNTTKDSIINNMQKFINNLNNAACNGKINLNLNQIDVKTFIINLKKLEQKIINKIKKVPKMNKIPESLIKKIKENPIRKQKTDISLCYKNKIDLIPYKLNTISSINENNNNSNTNTQNYSKKKTKQLKYIKSATGRNKNIINRNAKEKTLKLKRFFLAKNDEIYNQFNNKKHMNSLDNKNKEYIKTINNEINYSRLFNENGNGNGIFHKKIIDK